MCSAAQTASSGRRGSSFAAPGRTGCETSPYAETTRVGRRARRSTSGGCTGSSCTRVLGAGFTMNRVSLRRRWRGLQSTSFGIAGISRATIRIRKAHEPNTNSATSDGHSLGDGLCAGSPAATIAGAGYYSADCRLVQHAAIPGVLCVESVVISSRYSHRNLGRRYGVRMGWRCLHHPGAGRA